MVHLRGRQGRDGTGRGSDSHCRAQGPSRGFCQPERDYNRAGTVGFPGAASGQR